MTRDAMSTFFGATWFGSRFFASPWFGGEVAVVVPTVTYSVVRIGDTTEVTVTTTIPGVIWYHWYLDGSYVGKTAGPTKSFQVPAGDQLRVECVPTASEEFDVVANAPDGFPARRTLWWVRSLSTTVATYRVDQRIAAGDWITIAIAPHDAGKWEYSILTDRLDDLTEYTWRIVPVDLLGNDGTPITIGPETVVRWPDAPNFAAAFDPVASQVTFSEAA
jgi:hypothetical protein